MTEPVDLAMQGALVATLRADGPLGVLIGDRIVDEPDQDIVFPYLRIFGIEVARADTDDTLNFELTIAIRAYSRDMANGGGGKVEARRILGAVRDALHRAETALAPAGWRVVEIIELSAVYDEDADGKSIEGKAVYAALVEAA